MRENAEIMNEANGQGDVRKIHETMKTLTGKKKKKPKNLTTDGKGNLLKSAEEVATR